MPDIHHAARRIGKHEAAVLAAADSRPDDVFSRIGGVKGHIRLLLMLPQPGHAVRIAFIAPITIKDHHQTPPPTPKPLLLPDVNCPIVDVAQGFAQIDSIQHRTAELLRSGQLLGKLQTPLAFEETAVLLDRDILCRIGTDRGIVEPFQPLTRASFPFAFKQPQLRKTLAALLTRTKADLPAATPHLLGRNTDCGQVARRHLPGIAGGQAAKSIGEVVVDTAARRCQQLKKVRQQHAPLQGIVAGKSEKSPFLPDVQDLAGLQAIMAGRLAEDMIDQTLTIQKETFAAEVAGRATDSVFHELFFGSLPLAAVDQLQGLKTLAQPIAALPWFVGKRTTPQFVDSRQKRKLSQNLAAGIGMQIEDVNAIALDSFQRG